MKRQFVLDKEISLSKENDYLKTEIYANNLSEIINNAPINKVFTIGLFGDWGTGKSSIIETSRTNIETEKKSKVRFIIYDAWKYSCDSFRRMFLLKVQEELKQEQTKEMERFYQSENAETKPKQVFNIKGLSITITALILLVIIISVLPIEIEWKSPIISIITLLGLLISVLNGLFHTLKISINKPALFAPEQFEECFKQMMGISLKKECCIIRHIRKVIEYVRRGEATIIGLDKIVIVIDNIDRCHSTMAYQLLTDIKTFLSNEEYNIIFVIPVDDQALKKHLFNNATSDGNQCNKDKEEFLRKFFNVTLRIKPHQTLEMQAFARKLNEKFKLNFNNDTLSLAAKEFATNPRRIIQLFNNLSTELNLYEDDFAAKNEAIICAIVILREEYGSFYDKVLKNSTLLKRRPKAVTENDSDELKSFLRVADSYFKNTEISDIAQILTNTKAQFGSISNEIQEAIHTNNIDRVIEFTKEQTELKTDIIQLIHHSIAEDSKYESELQMVNRLMFISQLSDKLSIEKSDFIKFDNGFRGYYERIIPKSTDANLICNYANRMSEFGINELKNVIIKYVLAENEEKPVNFDNYVTAIFKIFNSEKDSKSLVPFAEKYFVENEIDKDITYTGNQQKYLFTDNIIKVKIEHIKEIGENDDSKELLWLFENKSNISIETYGIFFSHISTIIGEMRSKTSDEIISYINFLIPFVANIKDSVLKEEPNELFEKLFSSRGNNTRYYAQTKLIDECIENEDASKLIIDFLCQMYRITNNQTSINEQLDTLVPHYRSYLNSKLVELLNKGYTLVPLFNIIFLDEDYSSKDTIALLKNCFTRKKEDGTIHISEKQVINKIKSLLDKVLNPNVIPLINDIIVDVSIKQIVINDIVSRDSTLINSLPQELLDLAIKAYSNDSADNYSMNYVYLTVIAEKGDASQKSILIKSLWNNIYNKRNVQETFSIFEILELTKQTDIDLLLAHLNDFKENIPTEDSELNKRINDLILKFSPEKKEALKKRK
jgi:hypothetical protein